MDSFLTGPGPKVTVTPIDFSDILPKYKGLYAVILDDVLSAEECKSFVAAAEARTDGVWEPAMINVGGGRQELNLDARNCGRIIWDSPPMAEKLLARVYQYLPEIHELYKRSRITGYGPTKRGERWKISRLNERMRVLKYGPGQYFAPHGDGMYMTPDEKERSHFTLHLYLNDASSEPEGKPLEGGATRFWSIGMGEFLDVEPKVGRVLVFQQRDLLHSGEEVTSGMKLTLRTDMMYEQIGG
ncbi:MAG: hypothetical protein M1812_003516 [Candelaria pacifica]|nr:MAG: hypothetical protein M1812_003516 [Candelaria pacifica]